MSQFNEANYPNATPVADDFVLFGRISDDNVRSVKMQALGNLLASLSGQNLVVTFISANTTLTTQQVVIANSATPFSIDLPASSLNSGRGYRIFNKGAGDLAIIPNGFDTLAGAPSLVLTQYESITLYSDGLGMWAKF